MENRMGLESETVHILNSLEVRILGTEMQTRINKTYRLVGIPRSHPLRKTNFRLLSF